MKKDGAESTNFFDFEKTVDNLRGCWGKIKAMHCKCKNENRESVEEQVLDISLQKSPASSSEEGDDLSRVVFACKTLFEGENDDMYAKFSNLCGLIVPSATAAVRSSSEGKREKLEQIFNAFSNAATRCARRIFLTLKLNCGDPEVKNKTRRADELILLASLTLFEFGDLCDAEEEAHIAARAFKVALELHSRVGFKKEDDFVEYVAKIKAIEPSFKMKKRAYHGFNTHFSADDTAYFETDEGQKELRAIVEARPIFRPKTSAISVVLTTLALILLLTPPIFLLIFANLDLALEIALPVIYYALFIEVCCRLYLANLIRFYQCRASEDTRRSCLCVPSCSDYALLSLKKYPMILTALKIFKRLVFTCKGDKYIVNLP